MGGSVVEGGAGLGAPIAGNHMPKPRAPVILGEAAGAGK